MAIKTNPWKKKLKAKKENPWKRKLSSGSVSGTQLALPITEDSEAAGTVTVKSGSAPSKLRVDSGRATVSPSVANFGMQAGPLELPFGQEKKEKNPYVDQMQDTSMVVSGMHLTLELRGGERIVNGVANYCDGRWINVKQDDNLGNTPCFRPQITGITINHEPTA